MAQLAQGLGLDLADAFAGDIELLAHFLQRAGAAVLDTEAQLQHLFLPGRQRAEHIHQLLLEQGEAGSLGGLGGAFVGDEVAQMGVLLLTDGGLQRNRLLCDLQNLAYLIHGHAHFLGDFLGRGVMTQLLQQLTADADDLVDGFHHMHGDTDGTGLIGNGAGDRLTNPPGSVGGELVALGIVELFHRLDKAQIALLDQIKEQHAAAHIALGNGHHQTQIGLRQLLLAVFALLDQRFQLCLLLGGNLLVVFLDFGQTLLGQIALGHGGGQGDLLVGGQQGHLADLLQVHAHGIVDVEAVDQRVGVNQLLLFDLGDLLHGRLDVVGQIVDKLLLTAHLDTQRFQRIIDVVHLLAVQVHGVQHIAQLIGIQLALFLALDEQLLQLLAAHQQGSGRQGSNGLVIQLALFLGAVFAVFLVVLGQELIGHFL